MGHFLSTSTFSLGKEAVAVVDFQEDDVKSKDLATTLYYYDEAADKAKVEEPIDPNKEQPKVLGPPNLTSILLSNFTFQLVSRVAEERCQNDCQRHFRSRILFHP